MRRNLWPVVPTVLVWTLAPACGDGDFGPLPEIEVRPRQPQAPDNPCTDVVAACADGQQNCGELGVDCGGDCAPCAEPCDGHCGDGVLNCGESGLDCGGECGACIDPCDGHCEDGVQNCGETGPDCGGGCGACVDPCDGHCDDGAQNCGESGVDCGGGCGACGPPVYRESDCVGDAFRNGAEVCDDEGFRVPAPGTGLVLVCLDGNGGRAYVATNTGPVMDDGVRRCQGWEQNGLKAWDHLDYVYETICDRANETVPMDLSSMVGWDLYMGTHDWPDVGSGHGTTACIAWQK